MSSIHPATLGDDQLLAQCDIRFMRRSGPGGQNRNKVETAVILHHRPTGLQAEANERRSQNENREAALFRLRVRMALEIRLPAAAQPSPLWRSRCRGGRIKVNPEHADVPSLLAEALDNLASHQMDTKATAEALGCTATQLVHLLKIEPQALALLNQHRASIGLRPLN